MARSPIWNRYTITETIMALLNWGYGSGEELYDWLTSEGGMTSADAHKLMDQLNDCLANAIRK